MHSVRTRRWIWLSLGLVALGIGAWALLTASGPGRDDGGEIDPASRAALERVLRESAEEEPRP